MGLKSDCMRQEIRRTKEDLVITAFGVKALIEAIAEVVEELKRWDRLNFKDW